MQNHQMFELSQITKFKELYKNTGKNVKIAVFESKSATHPEHADWTVEVIKTIAPDADVKLFMYQGDKIMDEQFKEIFDNKYDLLNFSLVGIDIRSSKHYLNLSDEVFIVASSGNSGVQEYHYPAAIDKCLAVSATHDGVTVANYSTVNDKVDIVNFSGVRLKSGYYYYGTSCSAPYTTGMLALYMSQYKSMYGRKPMVGEVTEYVVENCKDVLEKGKDINSGNGLFILNPDIEEKLWFGNKLILKSEYFKKR